LRTTACFLASWALQIADDRMLFCMFSELAFNHQAFRVQIFQAF
jgi:hypothetical protein